MSKAKMQAAKELIQEKRYGEARAILKTVDHPLAAEWVAKIDAINPSEAAPTRQSKRMSTGSFLLVGFFIFAMVGGLGVILVSQIGQLPLPLTNVQATSKIPIPAKLSEDQYKTLNRKCLSAMSVGMIKDYIDFQYKDFDKHDFGGLAINAYVYGDNIGCTPSEMFQIQWHDYLVYNDRQLRESIDKGVAWTRFLDSWNFTIQNDKNQTATASAFRNSRPTEIMATVGP